MRIIARFTPEAWINDNAVEIDHDGPDTWDCTDAFEALSPEYKADLIEEMEAYGEASDDFDALMGDPAAPAWVNQHQGPFSIHVRKA
jgi:hypothetical protein